MMQKTVFTTFLILMLFVAAGAQVKSPVRKAIDALAVELNTQFEAERVTDEEAAAIAREAIRVRDADGLINFPPSQAAERFNHQWYVEQGRTPVVQAAAIAELTRLAPLVANERARDALTARVKELRSAAEAAEEAKR